MTRFLTLALLPLTLLASACGGPSEGDLLSIWVNVDMVYTLYTYPSGDDPIVVQEGTFSVERTELSSRDGDTRLALVTNVETSTDGAQVGQSFGNEILEWEDELSFTLDAPSGPNGIRAYNWSEQVP
jgi:hypothetical protein